MHYQSSRRIKFPFLSRKRWRRCEGARDNSQNDKQKQKLWARCSYKYQTAIVDDMRQFKTLWSKSQLESRHIKWRNSLLTFRIVQTKRKWVTNLTKPVLPIIRSSQQFVELTKRRNVKLSHYYWSHIWWKDFDFCELCEITRHSMRWESTKTMKKFNRMKD